VGTLTGVDFAPFSAGHDLGEMVGRDDAFYRQLFEAFCSTPMVALSRAAGARRAMEMLLTGEAISAQEPQPAGLVNRVVPATELAAATKSIAANQLGEPAVEIVSRNRFHPIRVARDFVALWEREARLGRAIPTRARQAPRCAFARDRTRLPPPGIASVAGALRKPRLRSRAVKRKMRADEKNRIDNARLANLGIRARSAAKSSEDQYAEMPRSQTRCTPGLGHERSSSVLTEERRAAR